jgi:MFS family permease
MLDTLRRNEPLIVLCTVVAIMMMGIGIVSPILPQYARTFGVNTTMVGLLVTGFAGARLLADMPAGRLAEAKGRRPVLIAGPLILALGSLACGLAQSYWQLIVFRMLQGVGSAMYTTAAMIMLSDISTPDNRGQVMSLYQGSLLIGAGLGPTLGGFIAEYFGLSAPFFAFAVLGGLGGLWAYLRLPESRPPDENKADSATVGASSYNLRPLLFNRNFILICLVTLGVFFLRMGTQNTILPLFASDTLRLDEGDIGLALTLVAVTQFLAIFISGRFSDKIGRKPVIFCGILVSVISLVMLSISNSFLMLIGSCLVMGLGVGISGGVPAAYVADIIPRENYARGMGLYRTVSDIGPLVGPLLLGWFADIKGYSFAILFNAGFLFAVGLLFQVMASETGGLKSLRGADQPSKDSQ